MSSPGKPHVVTKEVDGSLHKIGRTLAGGHIPSIAKSIFANPSLREHMVEKVVQAVGDECAALCSKSAKPPSQFRQLSLDQMEEFSWEQCVSELKQKCPVLFRLLSFVVSHTDHRNASKREEKHHQGICMATAVLVKERNREMTGMQTFFSLLLFSSRVQNKVCVCVRVCVCVCVCVRLRFSNSHDNIICMDVRTLTNVTGVHTA